MEMEVLIKIFNQLNIEMFCHNNEIREKTNDSESYYGLEISNFKCCIFSFQRGKKQVKYCFENKEEALKYFTIFIIKKNIISKYISPIIRKYPVLYDNRINYDNVIEILRENAIRVDTLKEYTIKIKQCKERSVLVIVDENEEEIYLTKEMNKEDALFIFFQWSCILYKYITIINDLQETEFKLDMLGKERIVALITMN